MRVAIIGATGMVGSALVRRLGEGAFALSRMDLRIRDNAAYTVGKIPQDADAIVIAAAKVGGIFANIDYPADFIYDNLAIGMNLIDEIRLQKPHVKIVFLGSSCSYPAQAVQPIKESALLKGPFEPTNEPYAVAKVACIKMLEAYSKQYGIQHLVPMPCNLYGPNDSYDLRQCHLIPALIRRFHEAKESGAESVTLAGSGTVRRECLHVDDLADAILYLIGANVTGLVNIGPGTDDEISAIAALAASVVGYRGEIRWDRSEPDGVARKLLDVSLLHHKGWNKARSLKQGLEDTYKSYQQEHCQVAAA